MLKSRKVTRNGNQFVRPGLGSVSNQCGDTARGFRNDYHSTPERCITLNFPVPGLIVLRDSGLPHNVPLQQRSKVSFRVVQLFYELGNGMRDTISSAAGFWWKARAVPPTLNGVYGPRNIRTTAGRSGNLLPQPG